MSLLTPDFCRLFDSYPLGSQRQTPAPLILAKITNQDGDKAWYLAEYSPMQARGWGWVVGPDETGWRDITMHELLIYHRPGSTPLQRDMNWAPVPFSQISL